MGLLRSVMHHPRKLWVRRALFQIHLWLGLLLALYVVLIALSGALLVYHDMFTRWALPPGLQPYDGFSMASPEAVLDSARLRLPQSKVSDLQMPMPSVPAFRLTLTAADGKDATAVADPVSGQVYPLSRAWIDVVYDFHLYLLLGSRHGMQWNGVGACGLLILALSGILLWWRGLASWWRGLGVAWRRGWRRVNYDLHHAIGFWTLLIIVWWSVSGIYFAWYEPFERAVNQVSRLEGMREPDPAGLRSTGKADATLNSIVSAARQASPQGRLSFISNPSLTPGEDVYVYMYLRSAEDFSHSDILRFDPASGRLRSLWHYGRNHTAGDWLVWSMQPLHFGTLWGPWFQALWCALGILLAVLTGSGVLMYWNRYLRSLWHRSRTA